MTPQEFESYRIKHKLSINEFCKEIELPYITYYNFIRANNQPQLKTWRKLEKFYKEYMADETINTPVKIERKTQTVYLESVEDLLGELLNGNEVHVETSTGHTLKIVDGFIVRYSNGEAISINAPVLCSERYYAIKPIPLNLEIGKRYIARDGRICTIFNENEGQFNGVFDKEDVIIEFNSQGKCLEFGEFNDLIMEK